MEGSDVPALQGQRRVTPHHFPMIRIIWYKRKISSDLQLFRGAQILQPVFLRCFQTHISDTRLFEVSTSCRSSSKSLHLEAQPGVVTVPTGPSVCRFCTAEDLMTLAAVSCWVIQQWQPTASNFFSKDSSSSTQQEELEVLPQRKSHTRTLVRCLLLESQSEITLGAVVKLLRN